ncbi:MAG TPA: energy-coupling factor transporter ATPase [Clostridia bacterium]|nr:energy-coupling factor transporter ATPase [Clostridia bacterium]
MSIVVEKLTHTYMGGSAIAFSAIKDIDLTVYEGEFLGIIGHTGSGKSTLIQHLNGLIQPTSGKVTVDGFDIADKKQRLLGRKLVGMVFQYPEYQLFEETVAKDIAYGPKNMGLKEDEVAERVEEAMRLVGLNSDRFANKSPFELSGGEKRRAALAGIIAMNPKYLVLDEPMAGLDPLGRKEILNTIDSLRKSIHCSVVMVSHSMDDVARCADRIAVLSGGELVMVDEAEKVFQKTQMLLDAGLDVPQVSRLALLMNKRGVEIDEGIYKLDDMVRFIVRRVKNV